MDARGEGTRADAGGEHTAGDEDLLSALRARARLGGGWLHVPFHGGVSEEPEFKAWFALDQTELDGLDDWARPQGLIRQVEARLARHYGLDEAALLVGGSSQGLTTALLAALRPGDLLLSHRGAHRALLHGVLLTGARLRLVEDRTDAAWGVSWPDVDALAAQVRRRKPTAVLVTSPTYNGLAPDLGALRRACDQAGSLLLVDAAHGAHFGLGPLPPLASAVRPDLIVFGLHKSGGAPTAGAVLGRVGQGVAEQRWLGARRAVGTSSPSYPLMAAIERAVMRLEEDGAEAMTRLSTLMASLKGPAVFRPPLGLQADPTRVTVSATGARSRQELRTLGVDAEYVASRHLLLLGTLATQSLPPSLGEWVAGQAAPGPGPAAPPPPVRRMEVRTAFFAGSELVPLRRALGRVLAVPLVPSPPGIPLLWPGEVLDGARLAEVQAATAAGQTVLGLDGGQIPVVGERVRAGKKGPRA